MTEKLEITEKRFDEINEKLTDINVINDQEQYKNLMKELKSTECTRPPEAILKKQSRCCLTADLTRTSRK